MSRQCHGLFRASEDRGQLFAEQHEDDTVERELDGVPHRITPHPRDRHRLTRYFGKAHGHARAHRGKDARGVKMLGEEVGAERRSEEHTSELQSLMRISYAVFCLKKKTTHKQNMN